MDKESLIVVNGCIKMTSKAMNVRATLLPNASDIVKLIFLCCTPVAKAI